ncbi:hypothetical protein KR059_012005, partial [Drosophila kikkawai]
SLGGLLFLGLAIHLTVVQAAGAAAEGIPTPKKAQGTTQNDKAAKNVDYCEPSLCLKGQRHVACNITNELHKRCSMNAELVTITDKLRTFVTHRLNELRNNAAQGGYNGVNPAARMSTLTWDSELSHLAEFNVQKCMLNSDSCLNTKNYKHVGQIVGYRGFKKNIPTLEDILSDIGRTWVRTRFSSSMTDTNDDQISKVPKVDFLQMVVENAKHVGCAVLQQSNNGWWQTFFTCNFDVAPIKGAPIFESSKTPASSCQTGKHKVYTNLCSQDETYSRARSRLKFDYLSSQRDYKSEQIIQNNEQAISNAKATSMPKVQRRSGNQPRDGGKATTEDAAGATTEDATTGAPIPAPHVDKPKLQKKFAKFLREMKIAEKKRERRNIVIITSNHEVEDTGMSQ